MCGHPIIYERSQLRAFSASSVLSLERSQLRALSVSSVSSFERSQFRVFSASSILSFKRSQRRAFSASSVLSFESSRLRAFSALRVLVFERTQLRAFSALSVLSSGRPKVRLGSVVLQNRAVRLGSVVLQNCRFGVPNLLPNQKNLNLAPFANQRPSLFNLNILCLTLFNQSLFTSLNLHRAHLERAVSLSQLPYSVAIFVANRMNQKYLNFKRNTTRSNGQTIVYRFLVFLVKNLRNETRTRMHSQARSFLYSFSLMRSFESDPIAKVGGRKTSGVKEMKLRKRRAF